MFDNNYDFLPASAAELDEIVAIEQLCYPHPWKVEQFQQELENPVSRLNLLRVDQNLCGYICYWLIAGEMQILNVATAPAWRRKGVAKLLLEGAFQRCAGEGLDSAWLEVRAGNYAAINLYQRNGFVVEGTRRGYYRDGEDALLMVRNFV